MNLPRLCDIDRSMGPSDDDPYGFGHTVSNGSLTKLYGPIVRTGWAEGSPFFISGLAHTASTRSGGAPSQLCAVMLAEIVENGQLQRFVDETVRPTLQRRHWLMMNAVHTHLWPLGVKTRVGSLNGHGIFGGYFVWLDVGREFSTKFIADMLKAEENVIVGHGHLFTVQGTREVQGLIAAFAFVFPG